MAPGPKSSKKGNRAGPATSPAETKLPPASASLSLEEIKQITEVINKAVTIIREQSLRDDTWGYAKATFNGWTALQFNSAHGESVTLRDTLRRRGVFVDSKGDNVGDSLVSMLKEIKQHEWTWDEYKDAEGDLGPFTAFLICFQLLASHLSKLENPRPESASPSLSCDSPFFLTPSSSCASSSSCDSPLILTPSSSCASSLAPTPSTSSTSLSPQALEQITRVIDSTITTINKGLIDKKAWKFARTTFKDWSALQFNSVHGESNILRDTLRRNGVFVDTEGDDVGSSLVAMLNEVKQHEWTLEEVEDAEEEVGPMRTWKRYIHAMAPNLIDPSYRRHPPIVSPPSPMAGTGQRNEMESQHARNHDCANSDAELWEYVDSFHNHQQTNQAERMFVIKRGKERSPLGRLLRDRPIPEALVDDYRFESDQRNQLMKLWEEYPKDLRYKGRLDSLNLMMRFKEFLISFRRYGLYEEYLQDALPIMMADGTARRRCKQLITKAMYRDWETVILTMLNQFDDRYTRVKRVVSWHEYTFDKYIAEHGAGKSPSEQAYDYFLVLQTKQSALDTHRDERSLFNRLSTQYYYHDTTWMAVWEHISSVNTAQKLAIAVREELAGAA